MSEIYYKIANKIDTNNIKKIKFITINDVPKYYAKGIYLWEIFLPQNDPELKICRHSETYKIKGIGQVKVDSNEYISNKIILGEKYSLLEPETYEKFGLDICDNEYLIKHAIDHNNINLLNVLLKKGYQFGQTNIIRMCIVDYISSKGNTEILDWWKNNNLKFDYTEKAMDLASKFGHIDVLNWWLKSALTLKYSNVAFDGAATEKHIDILKWWINSGLKIKYTEYGIHAAAVNGFSEVLDW